MEKEPLTWQDFSKVDMRIGTIIKVENFPEVRNPAYKIWVDFGEEIGVKKTSAQITALYNKEKLVGNQIVAVINFPPKQIANMLSECLILGGVDGKEVILLQPEQKAKNGLRVG
ncbi:MAG: tRNA-binding protein [Arenicella sp.]|jgi:tRNA-binding protein